MIRAIKRAYGGGYRAGMAGAPWQHNPYRNLILRMVWDNGWQSGTMRRLNQWLKSRKGTDYAKH